MRPSARARYRAAMRLLVWIGIGAWLFAMCVLILPSVVWGAGDFNVAMGALAWIACLVIGWGER